MERKPPRPDKSVFTPPAEEPKKEPTPEAQPCHCPFARDDEGSMFVRRQDLIDLGNTFSAAVRPIEQLMALVREQNDTQRDTNSRVKSTSKQQAKHGWLLLALTVGLITVGAVQIRASVLQSRTSKQQEEATHDISQTRKELGELAKEMRGLVAVAKKTKENVDDIKEEQAVEPSVQLVPETDPVKAKKSPVKVRITPRKPFKRSGSSKESPPAAQSAIELPISTKQAKAL